MPETRRSAAPRARASSAGVPARGGAPATLSSVCADLGPALLDVAIAPGGLEAEVVNVSVHDPCDPPGAAVERGDVVLAVGATPDDERTAGLVRAAGAAGAAAVVVCKRGADLPGELLEAAEAAAIALLTTGPEVAWGRLYALLQTAIEADRSSDLPRVTGDGLADLFALADATAALAGGPVTIEDTRGRVLAFSHGGQEVDEPRMATILGRRVPEHLMKTLQRSGAFEQVLASDDPVSFEFEESEPRRVIAIRTGGTALGMIWLAGHAGSLSPEADDALREAARIAALHLMRQRVTDDLDRRVRGGMLQALLRGGGPVASTLERLGLATGAGFVVLAFEARIGAGALLIHERLVNLVVMHLQAYRRQVAATALDGRVYVLVASEDDADRDALRKTAQDCLSRAHHALHVNLIAGMGERVAGGEEIGAARVSADRCVDLAGTVNEVVAFEDVHGRVLVADVEAFVAEHRGACSRELRMLIDHDREHDTDYIPTLRAFLDVLGDAGAAATRLQVHVNTVRYRLRRIVEITGVELADSEARFALELQLRALASDAGKAPQGGD